MLGAKSRSRWSCSGEPWWTSCCSTHEKRNLESFGSEKVARSFCCAPAYMFELLTGLNYTYVWAALRRDRQKHAYHRAELRRRIEVLLASWPRNYAADADYMKTFSLPCDLWTRKRHFNLTARSHQPRQAFLTWVLGFQQVTERSICIFSRWV